MLNLDDYINTGKVLVADADKAFYKMNEPFDSQNFSANDLCLVHTTDYFPHDHKISSSYDKKVHRENEKNDT